MLFSSFLVLAAALPFSLAGEGDVTVTICDTNYPEGYTKFPSPTYSSADYESPEPTNAAGYGGGKGYGYGSSPASGSGYGDVEPTSTCTDEEGGYGGNGGYGGHQSTDGHAVSHTYVHPHSSSIYGNHSYTATSSKTSSSGTQPTSSSGPSSTYVPGCTNTAADRTKWCNGYSVDTNLDTQWPITGTVRKYTLEVTNTTMAPDGFERLVLAVNGQYPGPTIEADWGDSLEITVINSLKNNGTSMHWHGLRQLNSNTMDGTNGITECPIAPGQQKTYKFLATQHGTSWYHSHFSTQYGDGVLGPIVIHGPATANYDEDLGAYPFTEWYHTTVFQNALYSTYNGGASPIADNGLINGKMVAAAGSPAGGSYSITAIEKGKKYRLRLINTSVDNHFRVSLDDHPFTVITSDFVPIVPYTTNWLFIGIGQRYDVIITADQAVSNYWFRIIVMSGCSSPNNNDGNIKSIFTYDTTIKTNPTSNPKTQPLDNCIDEQTLVPRVAKAVPSADFINTVKDLNANLGSGVDQQGNQVVRWTINNVPISIDWDVPTLSYVAAGKTTYPTNLNVLKLPTANQWYYWIIQASDIPNSHPIHLHGHDFAVLGTGPSTFVNSDVSQLDFKNPTRRDVAMMPNAGWLALAFEADNPGAWLMHCHIAWHVSQGFAVQFVEREAEIKTTVDLSVLDDTCKAWGAYKNVEVYAQDDSGLRR